MRRWLIIHDIIHIDTIKKASSHNKKKDLSFGGDYVGYNGAAIELSMNRYYLQTELKNPKYQF